MARITNYAASSYYAPALAVGALCGLSKARSVAFACRIVDRARNGSNNWFNTKTESGTPRMVKEAYEDTRNKYYGKMNVQLARFIIRTRPETWAAWEEKAKKAGLL